MDNTIYVVKNAEGKTALRTMIRRNAERKLRELPEQGDRKPQILSIPESR